MIGISFGARVLWQSIYLIKISLKKVNYSSSSKCISF
jgi:hypothetical protein